MTSRKNVSLNTSSWRRKALTKMSGISLILGAGLFLAALISWNPLDPSWNTASDHGVRNWMGAWGAIISDVSHQTLGVACYFLPFAMIMWGMRLFRKETSFHFYACFTAMMLGNLSLAIALGFFGKGGVLGTLGHHWMPWIYQPWGYSFLWTVWGVCTWILLPFSLEKMTRKIGKIITAFCWVIFWGIRRLYSMIKNALFKKSSSSLRTSYTPYTTDEQESDDEENDLPYPPVMSPEALAQAGMPQSKNSLKTAPEKPHPKSSILSKLSHAKSSATSLQKKDLKPDSPYVLPPLTLLSAPDKNTSKKTLSGKNLEKSAQALHVVLEDFGVRGRISGVNPGPVVTLYDLEPAAGLKSSRVIGLADDIARSMSAVSARVAIVPGRNIIGIELPNASREDVLLRELLESLEGSPSNLKLALALGKDIGGKPVIADLARMPHLLVAGTTGSGKSVGINAMILSLIYRMSPEQCRFIMIDPKMLELSVYDGIPHLLTPVVTDPKKAVVALKWAVREMENRYRAMSQLGVRNIEGYNQRVLEAMTQQEILKRTVQIGFDESGKPLFEEQPLKLTLFPFIVIVVDEMADLMLVAGKEIEGAVQRLAQMARAAGIHLIMATQRPSVDVITGTIKANFPTRISFQVTSKIDSRTILGEQGAEQLLGMGDMLYMAAAGRIMRIHGPFVSDSEVEKIVSFLKSQGEPTYVDDFFDAFESSESATFAGGESSGDADDQLYRQAVEIVKRHKKASTSYIQRQLQIGYNRAARLVERMEQAGLVSAPNHVGKREIYMETGKDERHVGMYE